MLFIKAAFVVQYTLMHYIFCLDFCLMCSTRDGTPNLQNKSTHTGRHMLYELATYA